MKYEYIVYKTTNKINGKYYVGVHRTIKGEYDGYIGNGIVNSYTRHNRKGLHSAVRKYGYENFERETLFSYPDTDEGKSLAFEKEGEIVTREFVKDKGNYNLCIGGNNPSSIHEKVVYQFDLQGNYITYYHSLHEAANKVGICYQTINQVCLKKQAQAGGFYWSYKKRFDFDIKLMKKAAVACYNDFGEFIRSYDSVRDAARDKNVSHTAILNCIKGKTKHCSKLRWRYFYGNTSNISSL